MKRLLLVPLAALAAAAMVRAETPAQPAAPQAAKPPLAKASKSFPVEYVPPENPDHARLYTVAKEQRVLEELSQLAGLVKMPRPLELKLAGCKGEANAWYDSEEHAVTFCYEFVADLVKNAPSAGEKGVALDEAVVGPFTFFYLHEIGHALIDILKLPVLGREEDAADRFAAFVLIQAGPYVAGRTLRGTAWAFYHDKQNRKPDESDFSDVHGLDAQRYYDLVCLAYGSDPVKYKGATEKAGLPLDRAESCADEWRQVHYGYRTVLAKYVDQSRIQQVREEQVARMKYRRAQREAAAKEGKAQPQAEPQKR